MSTSWRLIELEQQLDGAAEGRRRHDVGHCATLPERKPAVRALIRMVRCACFSGIQPSGSMHLGNYLGALRQWVAAQNADAFYCVVDLHALTLDIEPRRRCARRRSTTSPRCSRRASTPRSARSSSRATSRTTRAALAPRVRGHLRRALAHDPVQGEGRRARTATASGLFTYPVLMAGDILLYDTAAGPRRRRPAPAPRADPRDRRALQQPLRRDLRRPRRRAARRSRRA